MANPLSELGISDREYAAAVGTLVGEAAVNGKIQDYQAIADVLANRLEDKAFVGQYGKSLASQAMNAKEFSAWSKAEKHANINAKAGFAAALDPKVTEKFSPALQERIGLAKQAVADVFQTGKARGITQGATFYDNPEVTAKLGTGGFHNRLERNYGAITIGDHRFTGPNLRDQPFDPVTYNGQLAPPEAAMPDWTGVPMDIGVRSYYDGSVQAVPSGTVSVSELGPPDDFGSFSLPDPIGRVDRLADLSPVGALDQPAFNDIFSASFPAESIENFTPAQAAQPDFTGTMTADTFNAIQDQSFPGASFNMAGYGIDPGLSINPVGPAGFGEYAGVVPSAPTDPSFYAGTREMSPTPDFSAPSLPEREQQALSDYRQDQFEKGNWAQPNSLDINKLNDALMAELGVPTPTTPTQVASLGPVATPTRAAPTVGVGIPADYNTEEQAFSPLGPMAVPATSVAPRATPAPQTTVRAAPVAPAPMAQPPVQTQRPASLPSVPTTSFPDTAPMPPSRPEVGYQGFGTIGDAMGAIGAGRASMPSGYNEAWGRTAFSESPYAGPAYNDLMDRVAKDGGFEARKDVLGDMPGVVKGAAMGGLLGGPLGMVAGGALGGLKDMGLNLNPFSGFSDFLGSLFGNDSNGSSYGGYSIGDVTSPDGYASIGVGIDNFMGGLGGGGGGFAPGGMTGEMGGYGNADGTPSNNSPGTWG